MSHTTRKLFVNPFEGIHMSDPGSAVALFEQAQNIQVNDQEGDGERGPLSGQIGAVITPLQLGLIEKITDCGTPIMLDARLTGPDMASQAEAYAALGVDYLTINLANTPEVVLAAVEAITSKNCTPIGAFPYDYVDDHRTTLLLGTPISTRAYQLATQMVGINGLDLVVVSETVAKSLLTCPEISAGFTFGAAALSPTSEAAFKSEETNENRWTPEIAFGGEGKKVEFCIIGTPISRATSRLNALKQVFAEIEDTSGTPVALRTAVEATAPSA